MPYTTCYIDLYDLTGPTSIPDINAQQFQSYGYIQAGGFGFSFKPVTTQEQYNAFLHNPPDSNKIIKVKNLDFRWPAPTITSGYHNIIIGRAKDLSTGSIEPYSKFDTNAANLPDGVGLTLNPSTTYTALTGSFRQRPMVKNLSSTIYANQMKTGTTFYEGQRLGTSIQDLTLRPNEHIIIACTNNTYANTKYQISVMFESGSNTYYYDTTTSTVHYPPNALNQIERYPAAFVNNSNTPVYIHKIDVNHLYYDYGYFNMLFTNGAIQSKQLMIEHVTKDRIPTSLADDLINSDTYSIVELDTNNTVPTNLKCYKHSVNVKPSYQHSWGQVNEGAPQIPLYLRTSIFNLGNSMQGYSPQVNGLGLLNYSPKMRRNYNQSNNEIIIRPGEGLGFLLHINANAQDAGDSAMFGHMTFTVEDVPTTTTVTETGFGY